MPSSTAAVVGLIISAAGTVANARTQHTIQKKQERAQVADANRQVAELRRQRALARSKARVAIAQIQSSGEAQGAGDSSAVAGSVSSVLSQTGENISTLNSAEAASRYNLASARSIGNLQEQATVWQSVGKIGGSVASAYGGWKSVFEQPKTP